jgi:hypothetical protein
MALTNAAEARIIPIKAAAQTVTAAASVRTLTA